MKVAIYQPYCFPFLPYFQLMHAVDKFIFLDDVQWIKRGFINRNYIEINGEPYRFTIPVKKASTTKMINETEVIDRYWWPELWQKISSAYNKAPHFCQGRDVLSGMGHISATSMADIGYISTLSIATICGFNAPARNLSSHLKAEGKGQEKIINLCKAVGATTYVNAIGGRELYNPEDFAAEGIELLFLEPGDVPKLSIIDTLMKYPLEEIREMLTDYRLEK